MHKTLSPTQREEVLARLQDRFKKNPDRHKGIQWTDIQAKFEAQTDKLRSLNEMERTGGEPDVIGYDAKTKEYLFCDCSAESPIGRRNVCYDREGQYEREKKGVHPEGNALQMAETMSIELLTEEQYRNLQKLGKFDTKTSSWLQTPEEIRKRGGALFGDRRYDHVFIYHNSAPTFYRVRGFRGILRV